MNLIYFKFKKVRGYSKIIYISFFYIILLSAYIHTILFSLSGCRFRFLCFDRPLWAYDSRCTTESSLAQVRAVVAGFQQLLYLGERPPCAAFEFATYFVLCRLICRFSFLDHNDESIFFWVFNDADRLLMNQTIVSVGIEVCHIVGLLAEGFLYVTLLHQEGIVVADDHPVKTRHFRSFIWENYTDFNVLPTCS